MLNARCILHDAMLNARYICSFENCFFKHGQVAHFYRLSALPRQLDSSHDCKLRLRELLHQLICKCARSFVCSTACSCAQSLDQRRTRSLACLLERQTQSSIARSMAHLIARSLDQRHTSSFTCSKQSSTINRISSQFHGASFFFSSRLQPGFAP